MVNDVFEIRKHCEYILDEISFALGKLKSAKNMGFFNWNGWKSFFEMRREKKINEANRHIIHLNYSLEKLKYELYGMNISLANVDELTLHQGQIVSANGEFTYEVVWSNLDRAICELEEIREKVILIYESVNELG